MRFSGNKAVGCFATAVFLLSLFSFFVQAVRAETESIKSFSANVSIQKDGAVFVSEAITYNFGTNQKHGIFRDIPLTAANGPQLNINVLSVQNELGQSYSYGVATTNNVLRVKIGDANVLVSGVKTYVINYQVQNAIRTFSDHDELYWNVTGNQWPVAIQNVNASVILPDSAIPNVRMDCFTGPQGSTQRNCSFNQSAANVNYSTIQPLNIGSGLTLVLGMPLGYIHNSYVPPPQSYTTTSKSSDDFWSWYLISFAILLVPAMVSLFIRRVKTTTKPSPVIPRELKSQPVVVEYNPPDNLPPIEIGALLDRRVYITDISSVIMDLAVRGYLKIRYTVEQIKFWPDKKDFELIKLKDGSDLVHPADKIIFELLFSGRDSVKLSDLKKSKTTFQADIKKIQDDTEQHLHDEGYFDQAAEDRSKKLSGWLALGLIISFFGFSLIPLFFILNETWFLLLGIATFAGTIILARMVTSLAHKLTPQGISILAKILGFRQFLQLTEADKLKLLDAPEMQPEIFEKFLPYAMVLGVEDKWAKKFEGIYNTVPAWYEDPTSATFNSFVLTQNLGHFNNSFNQVFNITSPSSSSGFGGGGFSGGGSGGGGGGSW